MAFKMKYKNSSFPFKLGGDPTNDPKAGAYKPPSMPDSGNNDDKGGKDSKVSNWEKDLPPLQKFLFGAGKKLISKIRNK
tara:strand:+ start:204 stop:440 length:237 start_codon:yes stop_codon:yes gene_type:complete